MLQKRKVKTQKEHLFHVTYLFEILVYGFQHMIWWIHERRTRKTIWSEKLHWTKAKL